jgi:hypothetical protein
LFSKISSGTIAAASLGQVYRATLRETGEDVAIKVPIFTLFLLSVYFFLLKNSAGEGKTAPTVLTKKKPRLPQPRKSPNPGPVLTLGVVTRGTLPTWAIHGPQADLGRLLTSALTHGASEGIFLPTGGNSPHLGFELTTCGVCFDQLV